MSNKEIKVRIILRHNTTEGWSLIGDSEILFKGEIGLEFLSGSNIPKIKVGDGISPWNRLQYFSVDIPDKYTWNDLLGLNLVKESSLTTNLSLKKPGYSDVVNLKDLNENYDILDSANEQVHAVIRTLTSRLDNLITEYPDGELGSVEQEVYNMRTRYNGVVYESAATAMQAIDADLSKLSEELSKFVGSSIPDGLYYKDNLLYLTSGGEIIIDPVEVIGGSGGGGGNASSYVVELTNLLDSRVLSVAAGNPVNISFNYSSKDAEGYTDGNGIGTIFVGNVQVTSFIVPQGDYTIDVAPYVKDGSNTVKIQVTNSEGAYRSLSYTVNILTLSISSPSEKEIMRFYSSDVYKTVTFAYTVTGAGTKNIYFLMDGKEIKKETISSSGENRQFLIPAQADGGHIFEAYVDSIVNGETIYSNKIRIGMIWYSSKTTDPIILFNTELKESIEGEAINLSYAVFDPDAESAAITREIIYDKILEDEEGNPTGETERTVYFTDNLNVPREAQNWITQDYPASDHVLFKITCGEVSKYVDLKVLSSTFDREIYTDRLLLEFNATGRENKSSAGQWNYGDIKAEFSSNISWSTMDGWLKDDKNQSMLRLLPKSSMYIPFMPFNKEITSSGYTIEVEIATQNVNDYDSVIASSFTNDRGLQIKSQSARLKSSQSDIEVQFREDQRIRLTFVIEQGGETSSRLIYVYINGILCGVQQYPTTASFNQVAPEKPAVGLTIGAESCGIDVYFIRFYDIAFSADMQLNNFIVDRSTLKERIDIDKRNDIIDPDGSGVHSKITIESLKGAIPYIVMQCDELPQYKGDKKKNVSMYYVDPTNPKKNFRAEKCQFDVQGTSSQYYPVKNFKISFKNGIIYDDGQREEYADGFAFTDESLESATLCLKADFASSENANNVNLVDLYNDITPYLMPPQHADERVRQGIYGQPIVVFWENTGVEPHEISFEGKYNMNDDKSNENVFGFVDIDFSTIIPTDKQRIECWEWKNNNTAFCLFQEDSGWSDVILDTEDNTYKPRWEASFEPRFPDTDPMYDKTDALYRVISWVVSTRTDRATNGTLSTPKFFLTRDIEWVEGKTYYEKPDINFPANITPRGEILNYSTGANVARDLFYEKMGAPEDPKELIGDYLFEQNLETGLWTLFKGENNIIEANINNIGNYGVSISDATLTSFAFRFKVVGDGWSTSLYELFEYDTVEYRLAKFKGEFSDYFELDAMLFYYIFTETFLMIDNRAKNMFLTTFDGLHWFPIPYDMDTALGINNSGQLVNDYNLEDTDYIDGPMTFDGVNRLYDGKVTHTGTLNKDTDLFVPDDGSDPIKFSSALVYNGQESILWINFRQCFSREISAHYQTIRSSKKEFSNDYVSNKINTYQQAWAEVIWNLDQEIKFLQPFFAGKDYLKMAQGNKQAQRDFWLYNAFKYRDSKYQTGDAKQNAILIRLYNKGEIHIVPYSHIYTRVQFGSAKDESQRTWRNETAVFTTDGIAVVNDLETYIYSADRISDLGDLSDFKIGLCDFSYATKLKRILIGREDDNYVNGNLKSFTLGASDLLQEIDISNCTNLTSTVEANKCPCLEIFKAQGSRISGATFSNGGRLRIVKLPGTIADLTLRNQTQLETLDIESYGNIDSINIENTPNVPFEDIIFESDKLTKVRLFNISWKTEPERLSNLIDRLNREGMTGVGEPKPTVVGKVYLDTVTEELLKKVNESYPQLTVYVKDGEEYKAKFFINYLDSANTLVYSYIAQEGSDVIDPVAEGKTLLKEIELTPNTEDTRYSYDGWRNLPINIDKSYTIRVKEKIEYRVQFFANNQSETAREIQWIESGYPAEDPSSREENPFIPIKATTGQYTFNFAKWDQDITMVLSPLNCYPTFEEVLNTYIVQFFAGEKKLGEDQVVAWGHSPNFPIEPVYNYYWDTKANDYKYFEIYEHIDWDIYNDGYYDGLDNLIIAPENYTTEKIPIIAIFSSNLITEDSWETIVASVENGSYKTNYPIGTQKAIRFNYAGTVYSGVVEIVDHDYDKTTGGTAALTFILKDIFYANSFRNNTGFSWITPEGEKIVHNLAGGWTTGGDYQFYQNLKNIIFLDDGEILNQVYIDGQPDETKNKIKTVKKRTDFGPLSNNQLTEFYPPQILEERIWTPSAMELGIVNFSDKEPLHQGGDGENGAYAWFTNNASRIKLNKFKYFGNSIDNNRFYDIDEPAPYWTRTWQGTTFNFYGVDVDGSHRALESFWKFGLIFGFCI